MAIVNPEMLPKELGDALRAERERRADERKARYTQADAATEMRVSLPTYRQWESGRARPMKGFYCEAVARFLGLEE